MPVTEKQGTGATSAASLRRIAHAAFQFSVTIGALDVGRSWSRLKEPERIEVIAQLREAARAYNDLARAGEAVTATCATCGNAFVPRRSDARYCSPACRQRAYRERHGHAKASRESAPGPRLFATKAEAVTEAQRIGYDPAVPHVVQDTSDGWLVPADGANVPQVTECGVPLSVPNTWKSKPKGKHQ